LRFYGRYLVRSGDLITTSGGREHPLELVLVGYVYAFYRTAESFEKVLEVWKHIFMRLGMY
jgi:hypothetical protein